MKTKTAPRLLLPALLAAAALSLVPSAATAAVETRAATLDTGGFGEFSQTNVEEGALALTTNRAFDGGASAKASYRGRGDNGYSRGIWNVDWNEGEEVWFGAAYYLPEGFHSRIQGQVDLVRWDNWASHPSDTDWGGVSIYGSDHRARLLRFGAGRPNDTLVGPFELPEGRWFRLEIHQRLSDHAGALNELYLDGALVGNSTRPNSYGRGIERVRYGIVAIASGDQELPLDLWFDEAAAGPEPSTVSPVAGGSASPSPIASAVEPCATHRRTRRRGAVRTRRIATVCGFAQRSCKTVRIRTRSSAGASLRKTKSCRAAGRVCLVRKRVVRRKGRPPRRFLSHRCRATA